jgi:inward rectifier potassium channel
MIVFQMTTDSSKTIISPLSSFHFSLLSQLSLSFVSKINRMAVSTPTRPVAGLNNDTGFGTTGNFNGGRFINRDGTFNLRKVGWPVWRRVSIYYRLISMPLWKFISTIVLFYFAINFFYTLIYLIIGTDQFTGMISPQGWKMFKELFFFSTETFTTVGYGRVNPIGDGANIVAAVESMSGLLSFAIATGLIYGRFSRPRAHLAFSDNAIIAPYNDKTALMFRFACYKDQHALTDVTVQVNLAMLIEENGKANYKYYSLPLERSRIESLPMNWTVVHEINEESPLAGVTLAEMAAKDLEIYVAVRGFNDVYSNTVLQRTSYTYNEIRTSRKFVHMYQETERGTVLELHKLSKFAEKE